MKRLRGIRVTAPRQIGQSSEVLPFSLPRLVVLPLTSPWGNLSPLVKPGEEVKAGQCIARDSEGVAPPLHASVSGKVTQIRRWVTHSGQDGMAVVIEGNGDVGIEPLFQNRVPAEDAKAILKIIGEAGIEEVDPYPWPLSLRIAQPAVLPQGVSSNSPHLRRPIEFLIVNAIDRQPGVTLREKTLLREKKELSDAIGILQKVSGAKKTILAVSQDLSLQEDFVRSLNVNRVEIAKSPRKYPVALEPLLVQHLTGREMPQPEGDARAVGAVVVDVVTALQVLRAVRDGIPAVETTLQVFAPERGLDAIVRVRNGILLKEVLNHFSAVNGNTAKAIVGGPFLGYAQHNLEVPITQRTDAVFLQEEHELYSYANEPCINCGFCVRACPMGLQANDVGRFCEYGKFQAAEEIDLFHCIECGICAYVCPSKRPMLHLIRFGKKELSKQTAAE